MRRMWTRRYNASNGRTNETTKERTKVGRRPTYFYKVMRDVTNENEFTILCRWSQLMEKRKVGGTRYEARSRGRSFPDTLAFWACETPRRYSRLLPGLQFPPPVKAPGTSFYTWVQWGAPYGRTVVKARPWLRDSCNQCYNLNIASPFLVFICLPF